MLPMKYRYWYRISDNQVTELSPYETDNIFHKGLPYIRLYESSFSSSTVISGKFFKEENSSENVWEKEVMERLHGMNHNFRVIALLFLAVVQLACCFIVISLYIPLFFQ
jgi:hypothetical protein